jgi:hypothetical protein
MTEDGIFARNADTKWPDPSGGYLPASAPAGAGIFLRRRWQDGVKNAEKLATGFWELWPQANVIVT